MTIPLETGFCFGRNEKIEVPESSRRQAPIVEVPNRRTHPLKRGSSPMPRPPNKITRI